MVEGEDQGGGGEDGGGYGGDGPACEGEVEGDFEEARGCGGCGDVGGEVGAEGLPDAGGGGGGVEGCGEGFVFGEGVEGGGDGEGFGLEGGVGAEDAVEGSLLRGGEFVEVEGDEVVLVESVAGVVVGVDVEGGH